MYQQAEIQQRKQEIRQQIEQRVREIRVKINREKFSEAIDLAKQTLVTFGPDTGLSQLLNSAEVEFEAREKKRNQERTFATIRTLIESGNFDEANQTIDQALATQVIESFDPRIQRLSEQLNSAKSKANQQAVSQPSSAPPGMSKEYAFLQAPPSTPEPPVNNRPQNSAVEQISAPPTSAPVPSTSPSLAFEAAPAAPPAAPPVTPKPAIIFAPPTPLVTSPKVKARAAAPISQPSPARVVPAEKRPAIESGSAPGFRKPAAIVGALLAAILLISVGIYFMRSKPVQQIAPSLPAKVEPPGPVVDPLEVQQRDALNAAEKMIAANELEGAQKALQEATTLRGPLGFDIQKKLASVEESMKDAHLRQLRQREEVLWQQAMTRVDEKRYSEAQKELRQILSLPAGGVRREDANKYLDKVIPQRILQNNLANQAQQNLGKENFQLARKAADQLRQNGGDSSTLISSINRAEQARLAQLESQFSQLRQRDDEAATQQLKALQTKFQALADGGGPQSSEAAKYVNETPAAVGEVQSRVQKKTADAAFQQLLQRYQQAANSNDKNALSAARSEFQSISRGGRAHADEAQKYVGEIDSKLAVLNAPPPAPPPAVSKPEAPATTPAPVVDPKPAIQAVIQRYAQAFEHKDANALRQIWPNLGDKYSGYKTAFDGANSIRMRVNVQSIDVSEDGLTAVAKALVSQDYTPKGAKTKSVSSSAIFHLTKSNGVWILSDVQ